MPCTTVLVGAKASHDGSTMIARTDDGHYNVKKLIVVQPKDQPKRYKSVISRAEIPLPENPMRYTACPNVDRMREGIWAATGINEVNVGMTATETITTNARVLAADPPVVYRKAKGRSEKAVPGGIGEEDFVVLILPYIHSAREGVLRLAELLERYGTYESNGIAFNDEKEVWWMETIGGHHWIARKVPDDRVVIAPNQFAMDEFDLQDAFGEKKENLCSADLEVQSPGGFRQPERYGPYLQYAQGLVHGPVSGAENLAVGRPGGGLYPGERRYSMEHPAGEKGDGGGCEISSFKPLSGDAL